MIIFLLITLLPAAMLFAGVPFVAFHLMLETCAERSGRARGEFVANASSIALDSPALMLGDLAPARSR